MARAGTEAGREKAGLGPGGSGEAGVRRAPNCPPRGSVWKDLNALFLASVYFASDLSLGGVLLFPIDDKESRNEGQDLVSKKKNKNPSLTGTEIRLPPEAAPAPTGPLGGL